MTVNERLFALNKTDSFDQALASKDRELAIQILESCNFSRESALSTVTEILKNPNKYGYSLK